MNRSVAAVCSLSLLAMAPAAAQDRSGLRSLMFVTGTCERLVIAGEDASGSCQPAVVNFLYRNGRSSFGFTERDRRMVSFSGTSQTRSGDTIRQTLDMVTVATAAGAAATTDSQPATGVCEFTNPYAGRSYIRCTARTREGEYAASFTTNGEPPHVVDAPSP